MGRPDDYSDVIARIQVWRSVLSHLEPDGKWSKSPLLQQWGQVRYGLSLEQLAALEHYLATAHSDALQRYSHERHGS